MKTLNKFFLLISLLFIASCSKDVFLENEDIDVVQEDIRSLSLSASIPSTRIALAEDIENKEVDITWKVTDVLQLVYVQEDKAIAQKDVSLDEITQDGKVAKFKIVVPEGIDASKTFNVYGVFGGGGLLDDDPTSVVLPTNSGSASLASIEERNDVMLYFESEVAPDVTNLQVAFNHLGSLFTINLRNTGSEPLRLTEVRLTSRASGWSYNGENTFNLVSKKFSDIESAGNQLIFISPKEELAVGENMALWRWYPIPERLTWPDVKLQIVDGETVKSESENIRPGGKAPDIAKRYRFYANWNGTALEFANNAYESYLGFKAVEKKFTLLQTQIKAPFNIANQLVSMAVSGDRIVLKTANVDGKNDIMGYNALTGVYEYSTNNHYGINRLGTDSQGRIIGTNLGNTGGKMYLFKLETLESHRETYFEKAFNDPGQWGNGGAVNVFGDITKDAVIFAPVSRNGQKPAVYRFVVENGKLTSTSPELLVYGDYMIPDQSRYNPFGNVAIGIPAGPKVEDGYVFGDREEFSYFVNGKQYPFRYADAGPWTYGGYGGGKVFDMNGKKYLAIWRTISSKAGQFNILDITNPEAITMTDEQREAAGINFVVYQSERFEVVLGDNGSHYGNIDIKYLDNGNVMLYFMHGNSGIEAYELIANQ